ncbi:MAG: hypothetical protein M3Q23_00095 [Actinomycetota bacterium]|nr:hypothetical protein [Actinomycetota bacterium]
MYARETIQARRGRREDREQASLEWVLHRSNTTERIREGIAAGFDRLEMDVWCKRGELRLSHDPSVGRFVLGPNGVALGASTPPRRWLTVVRRVETHLTLPEVMQEARGLPPLLLDLKGRWPDSGLERLASLRDGEPDAVCSPDAGVVERFARLRPEVLPMYGEPQARGGVLERLRGQARRGGIPVAVSARAATLTGDDGARLYARWRDAGLRVYVWDVPDAGVLRLVIAMGLDGAIVREPGWIHEVAA